MSVTFRDLNNVATDDDDESINYENEPFTTSLFNQRLKGHYLILSAKSVYALMSFFSLLFIGIALIIKSANQEVVLYRIQYDNISDNSIDFQIIKNIPKPVYFYYELWNLYRNHRLSNNGFCVNQLATGCPHECDQRDSGYQNRKYICENETNVSFFESFLGKKACGKNSKFYAPVGSVASTMFNDTFQLFRGSELIHWTENGLVTDNAKSFFAAPKDKTKNLCEDKMFKDTVKPIGWKRHICEMGGYQNTSFIIWMQMAAYSNIKKLYRKLDENQHDGLKAGNYRLHFENNYKRPNMTKYFWVLHPSWMGTEQPVLQMLYFMVGIGFGLVTVLSFLVRVYMLKRHSKYPQENNCDCCEY